MTRPKSTSEPKPPPPLNPATALDSPLPERTITPVLEAVPDRSTPTSSLLLTKVNTSGSSMRVAAVAGRHVAFKVPSQESVAPAAATATAPRSRFFSGKPFFATFRAGFAARVRDPVADAAEAKDEMPTVAEVPSPEGSRSPNPQAEDAKPARDMKRSPKWFERGVRKLRSGSDSNLDRLDTGATGESRDMSRLQRDGTAEDYREPAYWGEVGASVVGGAENETQPQRESWESGQADNHPQYWEPY